MVDMPSAWQLYKQSLKDQTKPWHLLSSENRIDEETAKARMEICDQCPELIQLTKQCKQCGCFMVMKTKLATAECPLNKW